VLGVADQRRSSCSPTPFTGITVTPRPATHGRVRCQADGLRRTQMLLDEFSGSASAVVDAPAGDVFALITGIDRLPE
jgi:hypothetical protein